MYIYTLIVVDQTDRNPIILNVIASYTDEKLAIKERKWRQLTERPKYFNPRDPRGIYPTYTLPTNRSYEIIRTELITDKFTEFALGAPNEQSDTDGHLQHFS